MGIRSLSKGGVLTWLGEGVRNHDSKGWCGWFVSDLREKKKKDGLKKN